MRSDRPEYGTSMHYPDCLGACTGCLPPLEIPGAPPSPFHRPDPDPEPVRTPPPAGFPVEKWGIMNRAERRKHSKGARRGGK